MRKVLLLICKKYKSSVFHNTEDLNQLKMIKKLSSIAPTLESEKMKRKYNLSVMQNY